MISRKSILSTCVTILLAIALTGCSMGGSAMPNRAVDISMDEAQSGQNAALAGALLGQATLTESQASSLLTELLKANTNGGTITIDSVETLFEDDQVFITLKLADEIAGIDSIGIAGAVMMDGNTLMVDLSEATAGDIVVGGDVMGALSGRVNDALDDLAFPAVNIAPQSGSITVGLAQ